jgi:hypothetical protein
VPNKGFEISSPLTERNSNSLGIERLLADANELMNKRERAVINFIKRPFILIN